MQGNGRPTWAEIDLNKLKKNFLAVRDHISSRTKILAVVKANAYGHGSIAVSKLFGQLGADYFGVAIVEEAIELREAGIDKPILVLGGFWKGEENAILKYGLIPAVFSFETLERLSQRATSLNTKVVYHLKIDTGMGRIGLPFDEVSPFIERVRSLRGIELEGVFATLSSADEDSNEFTQLQLHRFKQTIQQIKALGIQVPIRHIANSAAIVNYPGSWFDMVRPGILLYGAITFKTNSISVEPVLNLKTRISWLKKVPPNTPLGYNRTFVTSRESLIATIPIGYYDGLNRFLSNTGRVIVRDQFAPMVGSITMDMALIDVTGVGDVEIDDEVIIIGSSKSCSITVEDIAQKINTIPYDIVCNIGCRVQRIYV